MTPSPIRARARRRSPARSIAALAAALVFAGVACGVGSACSPANVGGALPDAAAGDASATPPGSDAAVQAACGDYAYAYCNQLQACSPTAVLMRYGTQAACKSVFTTICQHAILAPSSGSTPAGYEACAAAMPNWACGDFLPVQNRPPACVLATGSLANGASCSVAEQCESGYCGYAGSAACGTCAPPVVAGDSCAVTQCASGFDCIGTTCVAQAQVGAGCTTTQSCIEGLSCVGGICQPGAATQNAPCAPLGAGCNQYAGLACNAQSSTCAIARLVGPGAACGEVANQPDYCVAGTCTRGLCVGFIPVGGACDTETGAACFSSSRCIASEDGGTAGTCLINGTTACASP